MVLERFHVVNLFMNFVYRGKVLGVILESVGGLDDTFSHLLGSWVEAWNLMILQGSPWKAQGLEHQQVEGKKGNPGAQNTNKIKTTNPVALRFSDY